MTSLSISQNSSQNSIAYGEKRFFVVSISGNTYTDFSIDDFDAIKAYLEDSYKEIFVFDITTVAAEKKLLCSNLCYYILYE